MSKKRQGNTINIPGVILDELKGNSKYENDERFAPDPKRKKTGKSVLNRKAERKQQREAKKSFNRQKNKFKQQNKLKKNDSRKSVETKTVRFQEPNKKKKRVSFSDHDDVKEISPLISSESDTGDGWDYSDEDYSQDERDEKDAASLIQHLKKLKKQQMGLDPESESDEEIYYQEEIDALDDNELNEKRDTVMNRLASLKGKKSSSGIRIIKEDELENDSFEEGGISDDDDDDDDDDDENNLQEEFYDDDNNENGDVDYELDDEQNFVMSQLAALKAKKGNVFKTEMRVVKENDLEEDDDIDEDFSDDDDDEINVKEEFYDDDDDDDDGGDDGLDDEQNLVMSKLAALKAKKGNVSKAKMRVIKEDDLEEDDDIDEDFSDDDDDEINVKEEFYDDDDDDGGDDGLDDEQNLVMSKLAALKAKKGNVSTTKMRVIKEDDLEEDDDINEDFSSDDDDDYDDDDDDEINVKEEFYEEEKDVGEDDDNENDKDKNKNLKEAKVFEKLKKIKGNRNTSKTSGIKVIKEDELNDDELSLSSEESTNEEKRASGGQVLDYDYQLIQKDEDEMNYYAKKLGINPNKGILKHSDDDIVGGLLDNLDVEFSSEEKKVLLSEKKKEKKEKKEKKKNSPKLASDYDKQMLKKDEEEIDYYAKKLGLKKNKTINKEGEDDFIGGLFDGLELDLSDTHEKEEEKENSDDNGSSKKNDDLNEDYDSEDVESDDFDDDDDLDEDDKRLLREMQGLVSSDEFSESESGEDGPRVKENPYVAPVAIPQNLETVAGSRYIPPALRNKIELEKDSNESKEMSQLIKSIKGPFNKLSEPNMANVINVLNNLYNDNARHFVNEAILKVIIQSVAIPGLLLESFLVLYATSLVALYKLQGIDFGAYTVQTLVEKLTSYLCDDSLAKGHEAINLMGLIGYCYDLNLVSSSLIYDIILQKLIKNPSELKTDLLLKLVKSCGRKLRSDDTNALKDISLELSKSIKFNESKGIKTSTRTSFLVDTITNLKNNKLKSMENENTALLINRLKKQLGSINHDRNPDPIKVNLADIENIEERGKWWLVGSAWKGAAEFKGKSIETEEYTVNEKTIENLFDNAEPNWLELAKQYRMNTDIRKAIFISIMSANDFLDAFMKLEKLGLKKTQKREIPNILMHCATMEALYNPYYGFLAKKLCEDHSMRRTFQLNLWDFIKELDGDDSSTNILGDADDDERLMKILNMGRFFGFLISEASLSLNILRVVNFVAASSDIKILMEIMLITILDGIAKKSENKAFGSGTSLSAKAKNLNFNERIMIERVSKCNEQPLLLKGLQYFLNNRVKKSLLIKGKRQKVRVEWGIDSMSDIIAEMVTTQE